MTVITISRKTPATDVDRLHQSLRVGSGLRVKPQVEPLNDSRAEYEHQPYRPQADIEDRASPGHRHQHTFRVAFRFLTGFRFDGSSSGSTSRVNMPL